MTTPSEPGWAAPKDSSNPYAAAPSAPAPYPGGSAAGYPGGAAPGYPGGAYGAGGAPAAKPARPGPVTLSFLLWVLGAIATVVFVVAYLNQLDWAAIERFTLEQAQQNGQNVTAADVQNLRGIMVGFGYFILGLGVLLHLFFAYMMWTGRNWARIVLTILGAFEVVNGAQSVASLNVNRNLLINGVSFTIPNPWISVGLGLVALVAIVLMYLAPSNAYFRDWKTYRQAAKYR